jgi:hypothetical protein
MTDNKQSLSFDIDSVESNMDHERNINRDTNTELPIRAHAATIRKLKEQENEIKEEQQRQIQELTFDLSIKEAHMLKLQQEATIPRTSSLPPSVHQ